METTKEKCAITDKKLMFIIRHYKIAMEDLKEFIRTNKHREGYDEDYHTELKEYKTYIIEYLKLIKYYSMFKTKLIK